MKRLAKASSSALFLLELVCSILIFAITCAACIGLLVRSHSLTRKAEQLNLAVREVCSAAELVRGADAGEESGSIDSLVYTLWPSAQEAENGWLIYYDSSGNPVAAESGSAYTLQILTERDGSFLLATLVFSTSGGEEIYSQQIERYAPEGGGSNAGA